MIDNLGGYQLSPVTYEDFFKFSRAFVSLDVSVGSTGWVRWVDGKLEYGTYAIQAETDDGVGRRKEFANFLRELFGDTKYEHVFIEDVIASVNFYTARILYQLNPIVDDLIDAGDIFSEHLYREGNTVWKKHLRSASNYTSPVKSDKNEKKMVRECMKLLGFGDGSTKEIKQDVYDAMGLAVGTLYRLNVLDDTQVGRKPKADLLRGFRIKQFNDLYDAVKYAEKDSSDIELLDFRGISRDLRHHFKEFILGRDSNKGIFVVSVPTGKLGVVGLEKNLSFDSDMTYLVIRHNKWK